MHAQCSIVAPMAFVLMITATPGNSEPVGRWWSGWGMGVTEYGFTKDDNNRLLISCDPNRETNVSVYIGGQSPKPGSTVVFNVNGQTLRWRTAADGDLKTASHVESSYYYALIDEVRRGHGALRITFDGRRISFPLKGSARVLPSDPCPSDFGK